MPNFEASAFSSRFYIFKYYLSYSLNRRLIGHDAMYRGAPTFANNEVSQHNTFLITLPFRGSLWMLYNNRTYFEYLTILTTSPVSPSCHSACPHQKPFITCNSKASPLLRTMSPRAALTEATTIRLLMTILHLARLFG